MLLYLCVARFFLSLLSVSVAAEPEAFGNPHFVPGFVPCNGDDRCQQQQSLTDIFSPTRRPSPGPSVACRQSFDPKFSFAYLPKYLYLFVSLSLSLCLSLSNICNSLSVSLLPLDAAAWYTASVIPCIATLTPCVSSYLSLSLFLSRVLCLVHFYVCYLLLGCRPLLSSQSLLSSLPPSFASREEMPQDEHQHHEEKRQDITEKDNLASNWMCPHLLMSSQRLPCGLLSLLPACLCIFYMHLPVSRHYRPHPSLVINLHCFFVSFPLFVSSSQASRVWVPPN